MRVIYMYISKELKLHISHVEIAKVDKHLAIKFPFHWKQI